ncbi:hypothetical protein AYI68_g3660 [Smittium mucronatum]|uniref:Uncharacterized protein n=1 Tax=Smittium mucronatum TaxID=133383 RepID=A0A1R0GZ94_9FUNG|nr:hypothetical protein AYI68_g3660 [Smittium mucronatum]
MEASTKLNLDQVNTADALADFTHDNVEETQRNSSQLVRIHMEPPKRITLLTITGALSGAVVGGYIGGRSASWQYLAERSHNLPTTVSGWYYYHKWKNYRVVLGAIKKASYYGIRIGFVSGAYELVEAAVDKYVVERTSALGSVAAGFTVSLLCASAARLPRSSFYRLVKMGTLGGFCIGVSQDAIDWYVKGEIPFYLKSIL